MISCLMGDYVGTVLNERYRVEKILGEGGMGAVYLGRHAVIGKKVAIKFLHSTFARNEEVVRRFLREAKVTAQINHANVVDVLDFGISPGGEPYLVMEYLEGESLGALLERTGPLSAEAAASILVPVLRALEAAHDRGVVHRDLKPENVFVIPKEDDVPTLKVIDFGVSKLSQGGDERLTQTGTILGTPAYMSPEQVRGAADLDHRSDLYAMGVIFYEMVTGALPFEGQSCNELLIKVLTEQPRPASDVKGDLTKETLAILDRSLEKDPSDRYQSAAEMIEALGALTSLEKRVGHLTQIAHGATLHCIGGDLGEPLVPAGESLPQDLINEMTGVQATAPSLSFSPPQIAERGRKLAKDAYCWSRSRPRRTAGIAAGIAVALAIVFGSLAEEGHGPSKVSITVEGIPKDAKIFYNDQRKENNPFQVAPKKAVASLEVHADGYDKFQIWIVPSEDKTVLAELTPRGGSRANKSEAKQKSTDPSIDSDDGGQKKGRRKSSRSIRGFFRRMKNKITN